MSATRSQLLGKSSSTPKPTPVSYRTGHRLQKSCAYRQFQPSRQTSAVFQDIVVRIHQNLVITPSTPQNPPALDSVSVTQPKAEPSENENQAAQAEIPFVPSELRHKEETPALPDSIVAVGQSQRRKRKRAVNRPLLAKPDANAQNAVKEEESGEELNILDAGSDHEPEEIRKKKVKIPGTSQIVLQSEGDGILTIRIVDFRGDFKAPPKDQSSLRSGNQSHTFR